MKATAPPLADSALIEKGRLAVLADLVKARLTFLVLLTTLVGFYIGCRGPVDWALLLHTMLGTALVASGASALNQLIERNHDARMRRTEDRPLPSGRMQPRTVLIFGGLCGGLGLVYLALTVNPLTSLLGGITLASYLFVYTPLKRVTTLNTVIGAIPGALPPLMGWAAARNQLSIEGWSFSPSCSSGNCRTSWPSPGFTATNICARASSCCRGLTRWANAPAARPSAMPWACCPSVWPRFCSSSPGRLIWRGRWCWARLTCGSPFSFRAS